MHRKHDEGLDMTFRGPRNQRETNHAIRGVLLGGPNQTSQRRRNFLHSSMRYLLVQ